jgi:hypothetical protein
VHKFILALIALSLAGCMTIGSKFDIANADQLRPGVSTVYDAKQMLGPPTTQSAIGANTLLQWQYSRGTLIGGSGAHLAVLFDHEGKMIRVTHRFVIN